MNRFYELDVHPRILSAVRKARLKDFIQVLSLSSGDIVRMTRLSIKDVIALQKAIANSIPRIPVVTALNLSKKSDDLSSGLYRYRLSTGCHVLDQFLQGGILSQALTEVSGESASGKTQLCLQLCLTVQLASEFGGLGSGAVFVCTEDAFPSRRLKQLVDCLHVRCPHLTSVLMDNIFIEHAADLDDLWTCLSRKVLVLLKSGKVKLIIVDSIAAVFRPDHVEINLVKRARQLTSIGSLLISLSNQYNIPVVVVNQVSDVVGTDTYEGNMKVPALGITWSNLVTVRLMLHRTTDYVELSDASKGVESKKYPVRLMETLFAPHLPTSCCRFIINENGIFGYG